MGWLDRYKEVPCPNGTVRLVLKEPQKDIPLIFAEYVPEWEFRISLGLKIANELITGKGLAAIKKTAKRLYDEIQDINASALTVFKMRYLQYIGNACANDNILDKAINEIAKQTFELVRINKELEKLKIESKAKRPKKKITTQVVETADEMLQVKKIDAILDNIGSNLEKAKIKAEKDANA